MYSLNHCISSNNSIFLVRTSFRARFEFTVVSFPLPPRSGHTYQTKTGGMRLNFKAQDVNYTISSSIFVGKITFY